LYFYLKIRPIIRNLYHGKKSVSNINLDPIKQFHVGDDKSSVVIFSIFFSHFSRDLTQIRQVFDQFLMIYGTFCNVFILSHVFFFFSSSKPRNSWVFLMYFIEKSCNSAKKTSHEELRRHGMKLILRGLWRHYKLINFYLKVQDKIEGRKHWKRPSRVFAEEWVQWDPFGSMY